MARPLLPTVLAVLSPGAGHAYLGLFRDSDVDSDPPGYSGLDGLGRTPSGGGRPGGDPDQEKVERGHHGRLGPPGERGAS